MKTPCLRQEMDLYSGPWTESLWMWAVSITAWHRLGHMGRLREALLTEWMISYLWPCSCCAVCYSFFYTPSTWLRQDCVKKESERDAQRKMVLGTERIHSLAPSWTLSPLRTFAKKHLSPSWFLWLSFSPWSFTAQFSVPSSRKPLLTWKFRSGPFSRLLQPLIPPSSQPWSLWSITI